MTEKYYLFSVWGSTRNGDRNGCLEEFDSGTEAEEGIKELMKDHPNTTWKLVFGEEVKRS